MRKRKIQIGIISLLIIFISTAFLINYQLLFKKHLNKEYCNSIDFDVDNVAIVTMTTTEFDNFSKKIKPNLSLLKLESVEKKWIHHGIIPTYNNAWQYTGEWHYNDSVYGEKIKTSITIYNNEVILQLPIKNDTVESIYNTDENRASKPTLTSYVEIKLYLYERCNINNKNIERKYIVVVDLLSHHMDVVYKT